MKLNELNVLNLKLCKASVLTDTVKEGICIFFFFNTTCTNVSYTHSILIYKSI